MDSRPELGLASSKFTSGVLFGVRGKEKGGGITAPSGKSMRMHHLEQGPSPILSSCSCILSTRRKRCLCLGEKKKMPLELAGADGCASCG